MSKTKDIAVNGVTLRLTRLSVFEQHEIVSDFLPALGGIIRAFYSISQKKDGAMDQASEALREFLDKVPRTTRDDILFNRLLGSVKIVVAGTELPLIGSTEKGGARCVMSDQIDDVSYLYEIALQVLVFNFERFFAFGSGTRSHE